MGLYGKFEGMLDIKCGNSANAESTSFASGPEQISLRTVDLASVATTHTNRMNGDRRYPAQLTQSLVLKAPRSGP